MTTTFLANTKAEFLKTRGTAATWLTLVAAFFIPFTNTIILIERADIYVPKLLATPWFSLLNMNWKNGAAIILPMFVILINNSLIQIEYRNNTWKQVYASPRKYADIFFSKFVVAQAFLFLFFIFFNLCMIISGYTLSFLQKGYLFNSQSVPWNRMLALTIRLYIGILGVSVIQFWLSMRFKNFIVPLGVGIGLWIIGIVLMDWDKIIFYPYMYATLLFFVDSPKPVGTLFILVMNSVVCFTIAIIFGFLDIYRQQEKGS